MNVNATLRLRRLAKRYWYHKYLMLLLVPGLISLIIFNYIPMYGIIIAFKDYKFTDGLFGSQWVGLRHFQDIFRYPTVWRAVYNSFALGIYTLIVSFPAAIIFALLINELRHALFKRITQTISYLPHFLSWVVVAGLVTDLLSPNRGILNAIIAAFGGTRQAFLLNPDYFRTIVVISGLFKSIGWSSIIYLAAISGADQELYSAADIDGASRLQKMRHVTLPAMYPVIVLTMIFSLSGILGGDFEQIFNLVNSQTMSTGQVISIYVYREGLENFRYSLSTAVGLLNTLVAVTLIYAANRIARKVSDYAIW